VDGKDRLLAKHSAVDSEGGFRQTLINGVQFRPTRPVSHEDGSLAEIARTDWPEVDQPIVQVHVTTTEPGRTRAWGLHQHSTDRLFVVRGLVSIVVFDGRQSSPTHGQVNEFKVSERNPGLLVIPPDLYHGWKVVGTEEAFIINMPTSAYQHDQPDALDLPYECEDAIALVPWRW
jgi:dTDP-4-dehydrorhamnose 3,5-epimerase